MLALLTEDISELPNSTKVKFYMGTNLLFISSSCNSLLLRNLLNWYDKSCVAVIHNAGKIIGIATREYLDQRSNFLSGREAGSVAIPWSKVKTVSSDDNIEAAAALFDSETQVVIVVHKKRLVGMLTREMVFSAVKAKTNGSTKETGKSELAGMFESFPEGVVILDRDQRVVYCNKIILKLLKKRRTAIIGENFELVFGWLFAKCHTEFLDSCPLGEVIETQVPVNDRKQTTCLGNKFMINYYPIIQKKKVKYIVIYFRDTTSHKLQDEITYAREELARAFGVMQPGFKIEKQLKTIPEYKDHFDHNTGLFEIVDIIPDGAYRHVISCLEILSDLQAKGVFDITGIDRNTVVRALIAHDLGKKQPRLNIGDVVDPMQSWTHGKIHAKESAKIIADFPSVSREVVQLVQYHHHEETELPTGFPEYLLPMLRLVKLVNRLSAAIMRRDAEISVAVDENSIIVYEKNDADSPCKGIKEFNLITGEAVFHKFSTEEMTRPEDA